MILVWSSWGVALYFAFKSPFVGIGIYTTLLFINNNGLRSSFAPSPAGEGWGEEK